MNNVTEEELNNKLINTEEKAKVIDAYNKLRESDRASYNEFIIGASLYIQLTLAVITPLLPLSSTYSKLYSPFSTNV